MTNPPAMTQETKITIIEDNDVVRDGFALLISSVSQHRVVNTYESCEGAIKNLAYDCPDIILMDLELPGMHGVEGIRRIKKLLPEVNILVISVHANSELVFQALCAGASGYITKNAGHSKILDAITEVKKGGAPMSSQIARMVVQSFQKNTNSPLTSRETEVLELLAKGKSYSAIANDLFVHKETIKSHIKNIYGKLQVNSKADAIEKAIKQRLI
ncbi:response regulator transcription factor [Tunicatimonas pelagia]|uniref:response regulator transcription factor n=1 Tax=Tunicatimonas pelagia TaxID=931531 RepID=UPI00266532F0|nr:response regulator transcription factor [Tunicatimonas pelagia]WKN44455.1 response regulator transcription factor [Tunicatimonas pelagia]